MKYVILIAVALLAGCGPKENARMAYQAFRDGCSERSIVYEVRDAGEKRAFVSLCEPAKQ